MKLCKDCAYFEKSEHQDITLSYCLKNRKDVICVITGEVKIGHIEGGNQFCTVNRKYENLCGMNANWFRMKEIDG